MKSITSLDELLMLWTELSEHFVSELLCVESIWTFLLGWAEDHVIYLHSSYVVSILLLNLFIALHDRIILDQGFVQSPILKQGLYPLAVQVVLRL